MPLTTYTAGEVLTAASLNDNFTFAAGTQIAIFNETQASGTAGGGFTSGSFVKRTLNTTVINDIAGCTLTSSVISLPAGTYTVYATAPAHYVAKHQTKLRNTTASTDIASGSSSQTNAVTGSSVQTISVLQTSFVLTVTSDIELQHRCSSTQVTNGLGASSSFGIDEVYSQITIVKIA